MWNEYMEWVDEWGNPIPIPDEEDDTEESSAGGKAVGLLIAAAALPQV